MPPARDRITIFCRGRKVYAYAVEHGRYRCSACGHLIRAVSP